MTRKAGFMILLLLVGIWTVVVMPGVAFAGAPKVEVCHIPPDDPDNFHTIKVSKSALPAHLAHSDLVGACNAQCAVLCNDSDACTVDDTGDCQEKGCPVDRAPVDCSDGNECTDDICISATGCENPVSVICESPSLCISSTCDPITGICEETPVICPEGELCDEGTGDCTAVVKITSAGEAYGHHGLCSGWNGCGDAATCAEWACNINGYSELVSYGASGPCTGFGVCHLFYNQYSIQYNWGRWCDVAGVTDIVCAGVAPAAAAARADSPKCEGVCETVR